MSSEPGSKGGPAPRRQIRLRKPNTVSGARRRAGLGPSFADVAVSATRGSGLATGGACVRSERRSTQGHRGAETQLLEDYSTGCASVPLCRTAPSILKVENIGNWAG